MTFVLLILTIISLIVALVCLFGKKFIKDNLAKLAGGSRIGKIIGKKIGDAGVDVALHKVTIVELVAFLLTGIFGIATVIMFAFDIGMFTVVGYNLFYSGDRDDGCHCIAKCVYGAETVDFSDSYYDEEALWANGFYLTHDPYNSAAFMNYALYVEHMGAFKTPGTDVPKVLYVGDSVPAWAENTDHECTLGDYIPDSELICIHYIYGNYDQYDCYTIDVDTSDGGIEHHQVYINTDYYVALHSEYLKENYPDMSFAITRVSEHAYIQSVLDSGLVSGYATAKVDAEDWLEHPEISSTVGKYFCTTYEYIKAHKDEDGAEVDYATMIGELGAYARWFYDGKAQDGMLSELSQSEYYGYGGQTMDDSDDDGYVFIPAYGQDEVYIAYYDKWVSRYGTSDESLADMLYYIMRDNKRFGVNTVCDVCQSNMATCEGARWWSDYAGLFRFVENERVGFEYNNDESEDTEPTEPDDPINPHSTIGDLRPEAMTLAQEMMSSVAWHVSTGCTCHVDNDPTKPIHRWYCCKGYYQSQVVDIGRPDMYACCGAGSTATAILGGLTESNSYSAMGIIPCPIDYTVVYAGPRSELTITNRELPVGTIVCGGSTGPATILAIPSGSRRSGASGHCTVLTYKDDAYAYYAGFGGDGPIESIASNGWSTQQGIDSVAKSEVGGSDYIYIYTPNRQAGGGGALPDIDGYANPTDIETGRVDLSLLENSGVDVGLRRFEGSWYTQIDGWEQADAEPAIAYDTNANWNGKHITYALYETPPYDYSAFSNVYFYDLHYGSADTLNWIRGTLDYWDIDRSHAKIVNGNYEGGGDDQVNSSSTRSVATNYYWNNVNANTDYSPVYLCAMSCMGANMAGGQPGTDTYWEKYRDVSGMYEPTAFFNDTGTGASYITNHTYNTPYMFVLQEKSTGKIYYAPGGYSDSKGHFWPLANGQTFRVGGRNVISDINDPNAVLTWPLTITDSGPNLFQPLASNVGLDGTPYYQYSMTYGAERNFFGSQEALDAVVREYGLPIETDGVYAYSTNYDFWKWVGENRAYQELDPNHSLYWTILNLRLNPYQFESPTATAHLLEDYDCLGFLLCSQNFTAGGVSEGYEYDPRNPGSSQIRDAGGGTRNTTFPASGICSGTEFSAEERLGCPHAGTYEEFMYEGRLVRVYLPYGYSESTTYPVAYIKGGVNGNYSSWGDALSEVNAFMNVLDYSIDKGNLPPMVVVLIHGDNSAGLATSPNWLQHHLGDFVEYVEENYSVSTKTKDKILAGFSGGSIEIGAVPDDLIATFGLQVHASGYSSYKTPTRLALSQTSTLPYYMVFIGNNTDCARGATGSNVAMSYVENSSGRVYAQTLQGSFHGWYYALYYAERTFEWYLGSGTSKTSTVANGRGNSTVSNGRSSTGSSGTTGNVASGGNHTIKQSDMVLRKREQDEVSVSR